MTSNTTPGNYVSTSESIDIADGFAGRNGYVYEIETGNYIDVNQTLGIQSPYPEQLEFAIPGGISPEEVVGAYVKKAGELTDEFIANPNYWRLPK